MLKFATEISRLVHDIGKMETIAVKVASAENSYDAQAATAVASSGLYDVIIKRATDESAETPNYKPVVACVKKMAQYLGKPPVDAQQCLKIAAAVAADDALSEILPKTADEGEQRKLAAMQMYGREYFVELLRGVI